MAKKKKFTKIFANSWVKAFLIALVIIWIIRTFLFEFAIVRDKKMENSLFQGDVIFINKLKPGPRLPITLLSFPFFGNQFPFSNTPAYIDLIELPYFRISIHAIQRNDVIAFNYPIEHDPPIDKKTVVFKRCIALPGDTLNIHDKKIFINNLLINDNPNCKYRFRIKAEEPLDSSFFAKYQISEYYFIAKPNIYDLHTTKQLSDSIAKDSLIKKIQILKILDMPMFTKLFPFSPYFSWSTDYFGTLIIPKKGQQIELTSRNIYFYKDIIQTYENNSLEIIQDTVFKINDIPTKTYRFKYNYYFVMDDNRDHAKDSRYWGFLPETHIIGKASFVLFNADSKSKRYFKSIE
ncbi:MAG: signal peptidase I [Bacteroidales bacterium]|nr:signal peptidase I [Bacteroidales bacterium]